MAHGGRLNLRRDLVVGFKVVALLLDSRGCGTEIAHVALCSCSMRYCTCVVCVYIDRVLEIVFAYALMVFHISPLSGGFMPPAVPQGLQHVRARLCILMREVLQYASTNGQLHLDRTRPGADIAPEAAADHSADLVTTVGLLSQSILRVLFRPRKVEEVSRSWPNMPEAITTTTSSYSLLSHVVF